MLLLSMTANSDLSRRYLARWIVILLALQTPAIGQPSLRWQKSYGGSSVDCFMTGLATSDGAFLMAGYSSSNKSGDKGQNNKGMDDGWLIKIDAQGTKVWDQDYWGGANDWRRSYAGGGQDRIVDMVGTPDGGYLIGLSSNSPAGGLKSESFRGKIPAYLRKAPKSSRHKSRHKILSGFVVTFSGGATARSVIIRQRGRMGRRSNMLHNYEQADFWIIKIDSQGHKLWNKTYGGAQKDLLRSMVASPDGGFLLAGISQSRPGGDKTAARYGKAVYDKVDSYDYWVVKIDGNGNQLWDRSFGGKRNDQLRAVVVSPDRGCLLAGYSDSRPDGNKTAPYKSDPRFDSKRWASSDYWVVKLDTDGNKLWEQSLGGNSYDNLYGACLAPDGGYLLVGSSNSSISGDKTQANLKGNGSGWIVKISATGHKEWDRTFDRQKYDDEFDKVIYLDGHYLLAGMTHDLEQGTRKYRPKYWLVKIDQQGKTVWDTTYAVTAGELGYVSGNSLLGSSIDLLVVDPKHYLLMASCQFYKKIDEFVQITPQDFWAASVEE